MKIFSQILNFFGYKLCKIKLPDIYIISFPKSGRTWLNMLLGKLFEQHCGLSNLSPDTLLNTKLFNSLFPDKIPNVVFSHDDNKNFFLPPRKIKKSKRKYKNSKIIFLVRDPRDVLVSSYFEKTKRVKLGKREDSFWQKFNGTISDYIYEKKGGFDTIIEFYNLWHKNKNIPQDFLLIRYEDLYNNTLNELNKIINFLNLKDVSEKSKSNAINFASFNNMRKIEEKGGTRSDKLKPADINDTASYKTRKGKIGDYKNYFSEQEIKYLNKKMKNNLSSYFGYNTNL